MPPEHLGDVVTLTLTVDGVVVEEVGRFASYDAAMTAGQSYFDDRGGQLSALADAAASRRRPARRPRAGCRPRHARAMGLSTGRTEDCGRPIPNLV